MESEKPTSLEVKRGERTTSFAQEVGVNRIPNLKFAEKIYIRLITRDIKLTQLESGEYQVEDPKKRAMLERLVYSDGKKRSFDDVLKIISPPRESVGYERVAQFFKDLQSLFLNPIKLLPIGFVVDHARKALQGGLIEQSLDNDEGEINCLEYSLLASLIAKVYYSGDGLEAYPFGYDKLHSTNTAGKKDSTRHFMLFWYDHQNKEKPIRLAEYHKGKSKDRDIEALFNSKTKGNDTLEGVAQTVKKLIDMIEAKQ